MGTLRSPRLKPGDRVRVDGHHPPTIPIGTKATVDTAAGTLTVQAAVR
ncbi:hypothetical protein ACIBQ1_22015 [Nonomuraea sp. NPDC050153]